MADASPEGNGTAYSGPETTDLRTLGEEGSKGHFLEGEDGGGASNPKQLVGALLNFLSLAFNQRQAMHLCPRPFSSPHFTVSEEDTGGLLSQSQGG